MQTYPDSKLKSAMLRTTAAYLKVAQRRFHFELPNLKVEFVDNSVAKRGEKMKKGRLGEAIMDGDSFGIRYNMQALRENPHAMQNIVAPHEVCHLVVMRKFNQQGVDAAGHGAEWCFVMKAFGKDPQKFLDIYKAETELLRRTKGGEHDSD